MTYVPPNPNGITQADKSKAVVPAIRTFTTPTKSGTAAAVNYEFLTDSTSGWFDANGYNWVNYLFVTTASTTGTVTFEATNDPTLSPSGVLMVVSEINSGAALPKSTSLTLSANISKVFTAPIPARYIRIRVTTAGAAAGSTTVTVTLKQAAETTLSQTASIANALPTGPNLIGNIGLNASASVTHGYVHLSSDSSNDISGTTYSSANIYYATISLTGLPSAMHFWVSCVSATAGDSYLEVTLEESIDGTAWVPLYHFERFTSASAQYTPLLRITGTRIRYVIIAAGSTTTPFFQLNAGRIWKSTPGQHLRHFYERTFNAGSFSSGNGGSIFYVQGTNQLQMIVSSKSATTPATFTVMASSDKQNWYPIISNFASVSNTTVATTVTHAATWLQIIAGSTPTGQTLNYVALTAIGP